MSQTSLDFNVAWAKHFLEWFPKAKLFPSIWGADKDGTMAHLPGIKWSKESSSDPAQIEAWGRGEGLFPKQQKALPYLYFCVNLRSSGLLAVDVDIKGGKKQGDKQLAELEAKYGKLPGTMTVTTPSGGLHYVFKLNGRVPSSGPLGKDESGNNLHIDLPPMTPCPGQNVPGKGHYRIVEGTLNNKIPALPTWVVDLRGEQGAKSENSDKVLAEADRSDVAQAAVFLATEAMLPPSGENRNITAYSVAAELRSKYALGHDEALYMMESIWLGRWQGHDFAGELRKVLGSVYSGNTRKGQGEDNVRALFALVPTRGLDELPIHDAGDIDDRLIPKREWLLGISMIKRFLTVTVAPGGTGKSNLSIIEALAVVTGREVSGEHVHEKGHVWLHNGEDPWDEISRRISAACQVHHVKPHELKGRFFYTSGRTFPIKLALENGRQIYKNEPGIANVKKFIQDNAIRLWVIDPFVDMHECNENDNTAINLVAKILSQIADETGCAIHVVHHTKKLDPKKSVVSQDDARGASALMAASRIGRNLMGMSDKEHQELRPALGPGWYVRMDNTKANLAFANGSSTWLEKVDVELGNSDHVGTLRVVDMSRESSGMKQEDRIRLTAAEYVMSKGNSSLNSIAIALAKDEEIGLVRENILRKLPRLFKHCYVDQVGRTFRLGKGKVQGKEVRFLEQD